MISKDKLGENIKELRLARSKDMENNYTQKKLAKDINKTQSCIGDIESGRTYPSLKVLVEIADVFNVSVDYLLNRADG